MREKPPRIPKLRPREGVQYRLYFFNGGRHIVKSHEFEAKDDAAATRIADGWRQGRTAELWQHQRMVRRWE